MPKKTPTKSTTCNTALKRTDIIKTDIVNNIGEFFSMRCEKCSHLFETFSDSLDHYKTVHALPGFLTCCDKKFTTLSRIVQHCVWHRNPSEFK